MGQQLTEQEKKDWAKDKRLQKTYGITLEEYNRMLSNQGGVCAICGSPPKTKSLAVDHDHRWKYLPITVFNRKAWTSGEGVAGSYSLLGGAGETDRHAKRDLRAKMRRASCRGLLCYQCNSGLRKYRDNPNFLDKAAEYLRRHQRGNYEYF